MGNEELNEVATLLHITSEIATNHPKLAGIALACQKRLDEINVALGGKDYAFMDRWPVGELDAIASRALARECADLRRGRIEGAEAAVLAMTDWDQETVDAQAARIVAEKWPEGK